MASDQLVTLPDAASGQGTATAVRPILEIENLVLDVRTSRRWMPILRGVSLQVAPGEVLGLVGESGSGKSMTCLTVLQLHAPGSTRVVSGSVRVNGVEMVGRPNRELNHVRGRQVGMVFQEPMTSLNPSLTIGRQLTDHLRFHEQVGKRVADQRAIDLLGEVGVPNPTARMKMYPHELSGGMRQRVMIAVALMCQPALLIADEPTTALDVTVAAQILDLLGRVCREHDTAVLIVTHDMGVVADICDRVAVMRSGEIVETAPVRELFAAPQHSYTQQLLQSLVELRGESA